LMIWQQRGQASDEAIMYGGDLTQNLENPDVLNLSMSSIWPSPSLSN
jgi:hypothetical protein